FMRTLGAELQRPQRPGSAGGAVLRRHGHDFELMHVLRLLPVAGAQAVRARVATADDHDALARSEDLIRHCVPGIAFILLRQKLHGEVNSLEVAPGDIEVARIFSAARQQNGVEFFAKVLRGNAPAYMGSRLELNALRHHLLQAPVKNMLFQLEVRNPITQETAYPVRLFKYRDRMSGAIQLLR